MNSIVIQWLANGFSAPNSLSTALIERANENPTSNSCMLIKPGQHITASNQRRSSVKDVSRIFCEQARKIITFHAMEKQKRSNSRVPYYLYSIASFHILLIAGDEEVNPGPSKEVLQNKSKLNKNRPHHSCTQVYPQCVKSVHRNQKCILCCICKDLTHLLCTGITILKNRDSVK